MNDDQFRFSGESRCPLFSEHDVEKWFPAFAGKAIKMWRS